MNPLGLQIVLAWNAAWLVEICRRMLAVSLKRSPPSTAASCTIAFGKKATHQRGPHLFQAASQPAPTCHPTISSPAGLFTLHPKPQ